jgi:hypothetical protein
VTDTFRRGAICTAPEARAADTAPEAGMVTAELAVALPALVLAGLLALAGLQVVTAQLRCLDAAAVAARLAGRGEPGGEVGAAVSAAGSAGARLRVRRDGELVRAQVSVDVRPFGLGALVPSFAVTASAVALAEPAAATP